MEIDPKQSFWPADPSDLSLSLQSGWTAPINGTNYGSIRHISNRRIGWSFCALKRPQNRPFYPFRRHAIAHIGGRGGRTSVSPSLLEITCPPATLRQPRLELDVVPLAPAVEVGTLVRELVLEKPRRAGEFQSIVTSDCANSSQIDHLIQLGAKKILVVPCNQNHERKS